MKTKVLEIRDTVTCMPMVAIKMEAANPIEDKFLWRCGYPQDGHAVVLMHLSNQEANSDPYWRGGRTWPVAHTYIIEHFDELKDGDVVDVRVILKEESKPAEPEIWTEAA